MESKSLFMKSFLLVRHFTSWGLTLLYRLGRKLFHQKSSCFDITTLLAVQREVLKLQKKEYPHAFESDEIRYDRMRRLQAKLSEGIVAQKKLARALVGDAEKRERFWEEMFAEKVNIPKLPKMYCDPGLAHLAWKCAYPSRGSWALDAEYDGRVLSTCRGLIRVVCHVQGLEAWKSRRRKLGL